MTVAAARGHATEAHEAPSRLLRSHSLVGHADRHRAAIDGYVSGVAAVDRPPARRAGIASPVDDLVLSDRLCHCAGVPWAAVGSPWSAAGAARHSRALSR